MAALMLAVFVVSLGYGVALPLLPFLIERLLGADVTPEKISRHTGLLTAAYALSIFLFAPLWGRLSDRAGARTVLLVGMLGFGATMLGYSYVQSMFAAYLGGVASGMFAAAVPPVATALIGNYTAAGHMRARRFAFISMAGITGFLSGPMLGVAITRLAEQFFGPTMPARSVAAPFAATGLLAMLVAGAVVLALPRGAGDGKVHALQPAHAIGTEWLVPKLLTLTFIVSAVIGVFEVGIALRGKQELALSTTQIALMFTECSLVMFLVQAIVFSPRFNPAITRWLIAPALAMLGAGLFLVPRASGFGSMMAVIGAVAASAGILSPILTYWISTNAGAAQGWQLGKQTAAASLGVTAGSATVGLLFNVAAYPGAAFLLAGGLALVGLLFSIGLPNLLVIGLNARDQGETFS
jgi:MFS family permease